MGDAHTKEVGEFYDRLDALFDAFASDFKVSRDIDIDINSAFLLNVCESFVYDITRYSMFHENEIPDRARRASYLCKWLMRFRPAFVKTDISSRSNDDQKLALLVNELFCMYASSGILRVDLETKITGRLFNTLLYSLRYRAHSEDAFILFFAHLSGI